MEPLKAEPDTWKKQYYKKNQWSLHFWCGLLVEGLTSPLGMSAQSSWIHQQGRTESKHWAIVVVTDQDPDHSPSSPGYDIT